MVGHGGRIDEDILTESVQLLRYIANGLDSDTNLDSLRAILRVTRTESLVSVVALVKLLSSLKVVPSELHAKAASGCGGRIDRRSFLRV